MKLVDAMEPWRSWSETPPPPGALVWARYRDDEERYARVYEVCRKGCCVTPWSASDMSMTLPAYWQPVEDRRGPGRH